MDIKIFLADSLLQRFRLIGAPLARLTVMSETWGPGPASLSLRNKCCNSESAAISLSEAVLEMGPLDDDKCRKSKSFSKSLSELEFEVDSLAYDDTEKDALMAWLHNTRKLHSNPKAQKIANVQRNTKTEAATATATKNIQ